MNNNKYLLSIFLLSFLIRIPIVLIYGDDLLSNEWEKLVRNLRNHNTLAILNFNEFYLPNLWMPPLYAYFLYSISLFFETLNYTYINYVLFTQSILASVTVIIFYKIINNFYSSKISFFGSVIFASLPLNLYASSQISSISLTMFLSAFFYFFLIKLVKTNKKKYLILFAITAGLLIFIRREFILIFSLSIFFIFFFYKIKLIKILTIIAITVITVSPYLIRNYIIFDKIIIQAGFGYNVWKANNPLATVEGSGVMSKNLILKINKVEKNVYFRINRDKIYLNQAISYIKEDPNKYLKLYFLKIFSYFFVDFNSSDPNYYSFLHVVPNMLLGILTLFGFYYYDKKSILLNYFLLIFMFYLFLFSFFAILPRYKLYLLPFQIIFSLSFIKNIKTNWYK